jgi:exonuclease III
VDNIRTIKDLRYSFSDECSFDKIQLEFAWSKTIPAPDSRKLKYFLPVLINNDFILLGIHANAPKLKGEYKRGEQVKYQYMGQIREYLKNNGEDKLKGKPCIIAGDFNENRDLYVNNEDARDRFDETIRKIRNIGLESAYNIFNNRKELGNEEPTCYYKNGSPPRQIDYIFISDHFKIHKFEIAKNNEWKSISENKNKKRWEGISDHCPLYIDIEKN